MRTGVSASYAGWVGFDAMNAANHPLSNRVAVAAVLALVGAGESGAAAERFRKLSGPQIRARFTGMEMTDSVHYADMYAAGGTLKIFSMGKKKDGTWRVQRDDICVDRGKDDGGSYQVWMPGRNVEFRREGLGATMEGNLQRPVPRN
jgi:hypothetical protein